MSDGFYRCADTELSTRDWVSLNYDMIPTQAIIKLCGENYDWLERLNSDQLECPHCKGSGNITEDDGEEEWEETCSHCDGDGYTIDVEASLHAWPVAWGTMWMTNTSRVTDVLSDILINAGFEVYQPDDETGLEGLIFGVDGGGYSFYGAHWIPLRALCALHCQSDNQDALIQYRLAQLFLMLEEEASREGDGEVFRRRFGKYYFEEESEQPNA